ncbi:MAG TPA: hypothetical protein VJC20_04685 [Candidatus Paceibacterota bacterium]
MPNLEQEEQERGQQEKTPAEKAHETIEGLKSRFSLYGSPSEIVGNRLKSEEVTPGAAEVEADLAAKMQKLEKTRGAFEAMASKGVYDSLSLEDKVHFQEVRNDAVSLLSGWGRAEDLEETQRRWEHAAESFSRTITDRERMKKVVTGELTREDATTQDELEALQRSPNMAAEEKQKLVSGLEAQMTAFQEAIPEVEAIVQRKQIPDADKQQRIEQYKAKEKLYEQNKDEFRRIFDRMSDYGSKK